MRALSGSSHRQIEVVYSSPKELTMPQTVIVTATASTGQCATAAIDLTDAPARVRWLAWCAVPALRKARREEPGTAPLPDFAAIHSELRQHNAIAVGVLLASGIVAVWSYLYPPPSTRLVVINPPLITLDPGRDERFTFVATVLGDSRNAVTWSAEGGGEIDSSGVFWQKPDTAAGIDKVVKITARSVADPEQNFSTGPRHLVRAARARAGAGRVLGIGAVARQSPKRSEEVAAHSPQAVQHGATPDISVGHFTAK